MKIMKIATPLICSRLSEMLSSFIFFAYIGHFISKSLFEASFAWGILSFLTVVGIGFLSPLLTTVGKSSLPHTVESSSEVAVCLLYSILGGIALSFTTVLTYRMPLGVGTWPTPTMIVLLASLPAFYIQITIFNFFNASHRARFEVFSTLLFNLALASYTITSIYDQSPSSALTFIFLFTTTKWLFAFGSIWIYYRELRNYPSALQAFNIFRGAHWAKYFSKGLPVGLCFAGESAIYLLFTIISRTLGDGNLPAYQSTLHFLSIIYMISIGVGNASCILTAPIYAKSDIKALLTNYRRGIVFGLYLLTPCLVGIGFYSNAVSILYTSDPLLRSLIEDALVLSLPFLFFEYIYIVTRSTLRGMDDFWLPTLITIGAFNVFGLILVYFLLKFHDASITSIFITMNLCSFILMILMLSRFFVQCKKLQKIKKIEL